MAATTPGPLVRVQRISKHFGEGDTRVDALRDVSLDVYPRQVVALLGPSGSGKTTLLNIIGCILDPSSGSMELDGESVVQDGRWQRGDLRRLRLEKIGFIFQFHNLLPFLDATDNVSLVLQLAGADRIHAHRRAVELLDYLEVGNRKNAMPAKLSGGEAQRVAIARALANSPRIILADEPTAALDSKRAGIVMDLLRKLAVEQNAAIIAVTHDEKIFNRFDHIFQLRDGRLDGGYRVGRPGDIGSSTSSISSCEENSGRSARVRNRDSVPAMNRSVALIGFLGLCPQAGQAGADLKPAWQ